MKRLVQWALRFSLLTASTLSTANAQSCPDRAVSSIQAIQDRGDPAIFIDFTGLCLSVINDSESRILPPNSVVSVYAIHPDGSKVTIKADGPTGTSEGAVSTPEGVATAGEKQTLLDLGGPPDVMWARHVISAPLPGSVTLTATCKKCGPDDATETKITNFVVAQHYRAAVRLGVAALLGPTDREYAVFTVPGSAQAEVTSTRLQGTVPAHLELVVGIVPFLERGGRSYALEQEGRWRPQVAPYLGLGLVGASIEETLTMLRSVHLGVDLEFGKGVSASAVLTGRRVQSLATGYTLGGPVPSDVQTIPTAWGYGLGGGFVLNFSPEFLRFKRSQP